MDPIVRVRGARRVAGHHGTDDGDSAAALEQESMTGIRSEQPADDAIVCPAGDVHAVKRARRVASVKFYVLPRFADESRLRPAFRVNVRHPHPAWREAAR